MVVINQYQYDDWGNIVNQNPTSNSTTNSFKYAGEQYDEETGLYYLRARFYDPAVGRFINEDTYEGQIDNPLTLNLYTYVHNNPLINIDPTGHWCTSADGKYSHAGDCTSATSKVSNDTDHIGQKEVWKDVKIGAGLTKDEAKFNPIKAESSSSAKVTVIKNTTIGIVDATAGKVISNISSTKPIPVSSNAITGVTFRPVVDTVKGTSKYIGPAIVLSTGYDLYVDAKTYRGSNLVKASLVDLGASGLGIMATVVVLQG